MAINAGASKRFPNRTLSRHHSRKFPERDRVAECLNCRARTAISIGVADRDLLVQHMLKLKLDAVAHVTPMALASCKEPSSLLLVFGFNTPLLGTCDEHRCVESFELGLSFECRNSHRRLPQSESLLTGFYPLCA